MVNCSGATGSGINFIDSGGWALSNLPDHIANHPSRNTYFGLPFLLGLLGMFFHYKRHKNDFTIVSAALLFHRTGNYNLP
jgi:hypothetical protein